MGLDIHQDEYSDRTNIRGDNKFVEVDNIPIEFVNLIDIVKPDYEDWEKDYFTHYSRDVVKREINIQSSLGIFEMNGTPYEQCLSQIYKLQTD